MHTQLPHLILGAGEHGSREFPNINVPFSDLPPPARNSVVNSYPFPIILKPECLNYNHSRNEPHSILSAWFGALLCLTQFKGRERVDFVTPEKWKWKSISRIRLFVTHELYNPWDSPGQNTGVGSLSLLQGIFPTQGSNPGLPHCRRILYQLICGKPKQHEKGYLWKKSLCLSNILELLQMPHQLYLPFDGSPWVQSLPPKPQAFKWSHKCYLGV